jgi:hypothetical protein
MAENHDREILLTPGPLTTAEATKRAMLRDWGSRDAAFMELTARVRRRLTALAGAAETHVCVPVQGSGTFTVEAALGTLVPFIIAVYLAARNGYAELLDDGLRVRVGFLVNAFVPYDQIDVVSGPTKRSRAAYGVSPSYRRHELNLGLLESAVEVRLVRRRRMGTRWLFPFLRVRTLWLGVSEPARFIRELRTHVGD